MSMPLGSTACLEDATELAVWILDRVSKFDRFHRFSLGSRLSDRTLSLATAIYHAGLGSERLQLELHPKKRQIVPARVGVSFLGFRHYPGGARRLLPSNGRRFGSRLKRMVMDVGQGLMQMEDAVDRITSWQSHAAHGNTVQLQRALLTQCGAARAIGLEPRVARRLLEQQ